MIKKTICKSTKVLCYIVLVLIVAFRFALIVSKNKDKATQKYRTYYRMLLSWLDMLEDGKKLCNYLKRNGYNNVAIYGGRDSGWHVVKQLQKTEIIVKYVIDKIVFSGEIGSLSIFRPDDELPEVDAVIVTPVWDYCNIKEQISRQINCPIISLEDVIAGAIDE